MKYTITADAKQAPNVTELEAKIDGNTWVFDVLIIDPEIIGTMPSGEPVWPDVVETQITLVRAMKFADGDDRDGIEVSVEAALQGFLSVAENALQAYYETLASMTEDFAKQNY